ncbi:MAG: TerB family tellurite resistance protein [Desulfobacterales bacterium]|nr:TerB family tellurite resistance protein [Desulfobacterales bacterium]MDJ0991582.1 TerB family tellurite resistance protein [Desulfobacterales bacterium]
MLDVVKRFFSPVDTKTDPGRSGDNAHDLKMAVCALFVEMARIDESFSADEMAAVIAILQDKYGLSPENAAAMIAAAETELEQSVDYWQFARLINANYSMDEKVAIIEMLWRIVYIDGHLDKHEDYLMHKLARLLRLHHQQLIDAKKKVLYGPKDG